MTTYADQKTRIRRFLRDPNANIWADGLLLRLYNDVQREYQQKTGYLEDIQSVRVPPIFDQSYLYDWEYAYRPQSGGTIYQAFSYLEQAETVFCHRFEPQANWGVIDTETIDEGDHATHPWEHFISVAPGELIPIHMPYGFQKARLVAWDREPIDTLDKKGITSQDASWLTRTGEPTGYWRPDTQSDIFYLYPQPSTVVWSDILGDSVPVDADYVYTADFELDDAYITGEERLFTREDSTDEINYVFDWELEIEAKNDQAAARAMWDLESPHAPGSYLAGQVLHDSSNTELLEVGTIAAGIADLFSQDKGIVTDIISPDDTVLFIYEKRPVDIESDSDSGSFPDYLGKYIEYGVLERAYAADTDGQIQSLRDYWAMRKDLGIKAIQRYMSMRNQDRDYRMVTKGSPFVRTKRQPRLPDHYPAQVR